MTLMQASPCEDISAFAARMVVKAYETGGVVLGEFNQHTLEARPGMTRLDVMLPWSEAQLKSYREGK